MVLKSHSEESKPNFRLVISFISFASGIDQETKEAIDEYIVKYEEKKDINLAREEVRWGREGEIDYCFNLTELHQRDREFFIAEMRFLAKKSKQVIVRENALCGM